MRLAISPKWELDVDVIHWKPTYGTSELRIKATNGPNIVLLPSVLPPLGVEIMLRRVPSEASADPRRATKTRERSGDYSDWRITGKKAFWE